MIPTKADASRPFPETNQVLNECGLLEVGPVPDEMKRKRCSRIKLRGISNCVSEMLMQEDVVLFYAGLPFLAAMMDGNGSSKIALCKVIALKSNDRSR